MADRVTTLQATDWFGAPRPSLKFGLGPKVALKKVLPIAANYPRHASTGDETSCRMRDDRWQPVQQFWRGMLGERRDNGRIADDLLEAADAVDGDLAVKLAQYDAAARRQNPAGAAQYDRLVKRLCELGAVGSVPKEGEPFPEFQLTAHTGELVRLSELTAQGPLVVSFNRGHWCPYCRLELRCLARLAPALQARQAQCVAIVPERPEFASQMVARDQLPQTERPSSKTNINNRRYAAGPLELDCQQ